jgi:hypothetical protein
MVWLQNSILECLHYHIFSNMLFNEIFETYCTQILSCFGPRVGAWLIIKPIFLGFQLFFLIFFIAFRNAPSFNCKYPLMHVHTSHWPYRYPPFTLCSWQQAHKNPWCNSRHLCYHCVGCWLPCGVKTTTCVFFKHVQFLMLTNWHYAHQR